MTRPELFKCIDSFLENLSSRPPLDQLATIEANPGIMLPMATKDRLEILAHYRSICRLLANTRPGSGKVQKKCMKLLYEAKTMLRQLMGHIEPHTSEAKQALFVLSSWDLVLHIMAPTVYHDFYKLLVLTDSIPDFLVNLMIPLLSDTRFGCSVLALL
ncbi:unnamed protein product [Peronospora destructor]|uniref:Uncharacterized protein n=1 Tax=Peronospora destructor TaxID=86335 RepID=A0AAV0TFD9_9STRA|nr:unnamed protein product [Peronospora destructor]